MGHFLNRSMGWFKLTFEEEMIAVTAFSVGNTVTIIVMWLLGWFMPPSILGWAKKKEPTEHVPSREEVLKDPGTLSVGWLKQTLRESRWHRDGRND